MAAIVQREPRDDVTARLDSLLAQLSTQGTMPSAAGVPGVPNLMGQRPARLPITAERVREHLRIHPEDASLSVRQLAEKLQVSKSTVSRVKQEIQP
jgi:ribosome-binding protein aMBF1 (putative translation factor)